MFRYTFLAGLPAAAGLYFLDHRAAGIVGLISILVSFLAIVFSMGE